MDLSSELDLSIEPCTYMYTNRAVFLAQNKNKSKGILLITVRQPVIRGLLLTCYFCG